MNLPCINCLCFPICKSPISISNNNLELMCHIEQSLVYKCSLIYDFIYWNDNDQTFGTNMNLVMNYFRFEEVI